jgi:hypothetical protein
MNGGLMIKDNQSVQSIKRFIINELQSVYSYCGVIESDDVIILNSGDDIKITIEKY